MFGLRYRRTLRLGEPRGVRPPETLPCPACKTAAAHEAALSSGFVCPACGQYLRVPPRDRIAMIGDPGSFRELAGGVSSVDFLHFPDYQNKLDAARDATGECAAVVCGRMSLSGMPAAVFVMDPRFIMASMGSAVGEKITRTFEYATAHRLPVIGFTASGGARMQEGILSLMQMAKCSGAVKKHSDSGGLYMTVLTDPTTGGVTASFAMQGDIILAEPGALVGFAGRRVIEQTTGARLPDDFQRAEFLQAHGFVDRVVARESLKETLTLLLRQHRRGVGA
ncbi:MAG: acetyl-CoA carboxylase carboxyltransferase subunit beta [Eubacteriales bacterium]